MVKIGFIFPGQGAQSVGMGKDFYSSYPVAKNTFDHASDILGFDIKEVCFNGPEEELTQTVNAQVAIFTTSVAILKTISTQFPALKPSVSCGLSLGEYSALVSADVIDFETALRVVRQRGLLMEDAAKKNPGTMVSLIGLSEEMCREVARESATDVANYNSTEQIVLSGSKDAICLAHDIALAKGAKKAIMLNVSGAFHSRLMEPAAIGMKAVLSDVTLHVPATGFVPNVKASFEMDPIVIKNHLISQVSNSVKWTQTMQFLSAQGNKKFLEIGPGKVLKGLARRIDKDMQVESISSVADLSLIENLVLTKE
jgi:[acyl-carrier-protein] S-malonyltransferase